MSCKLSDDELADLCARSSMPIRNGSMASEHALDNARRQVLTAQLVTYLDGKGWSFADFQGKARKLGLKVVSATGQLEVRPYPPTIRSEITSRDVVFFALGGEVTAPSVAAHVAQFGALDTLMLVDVATHLAPAELRALLLQTRRRTVFSIEHDYLHYGLPKGVTVASSGGRHVFLRAVPGHADNTPDLVRLWMLDRFVDAGDGNWIMVDCVVPAIGTHVVYAYTLVDTPPAECVTLDSDFWSWYRTGVGIGHYKFAKLTAKGIGEVWVSATHIFTRKMPSNAITVMHRQTADATLKAISLRPLTHATAKQVMSAVGDSAGASRATAYEVFDLTVADNLTNDLPARGHRLSWWQRFFAPKNVDEVAERAGIVGAPIAPPAISKWQGIAMALLQGVSIKGLVRAASLIPVVVVLLAWRRHKRHSLVAAVTNVALGAAGVSARVDPSTVWGMRVLATNERPSMLQNLRYWGRKAAEFCMGAAPVKTAASSVVSRVLKRLMPASAVAACHGNVGAMFLITCTLSPIVEETLHSCVKDYSPRFGAALRGVHMAWEYYIHGGSNAYIPTAILHGVLQTLPLPHAVLAHTIWNVGVMYRHVAPGNFSSQPGYLGACHEAPGYVVDASKPLRPMRPGADVEVRVSGVVTNPSVLRDYEFQAAAAPRLFAHGYVFLGYAPGIQARHPYNMYVGIRNRMLMEVAPAGEGAWKSVLRKACQSGLLRSCPIEAVSYQQWLSRYPGKKQRALEARLGKLKEGVPVNYTISVFDKVEKNASLEVSFADSLASDYKDPRVISGQADVAVQLVSNPVFFCLGNALSQLWNGTHRLVQGREEWHCYPWIVLGGSPDEKDHSLSSRLQAWLTAVLEAFDGHQRACAIVVSGDDSLILVKYRGVIRALFADANRWDAHVCSDAVEVEKQSYDTICGGLLQVVDERDEYVVADIASAEHAMTMSLKGRFKCSLYLNDDITISGTAPGSRKSGDGNTSLGNGVLNLEASFDLVDEHASSIIAGEVGAVTAHWANLGHSVVAYITEDVTLGDFCSMRMMPVGSCIYCIPKPGKFLRRFGCSVGKARTKEEIQAILFQYQPYANVPFIGPVVRHLTNWYGLKDAAVEELRHSSIYGVKAVVPPPTGETWEWFARVYGVSQAEHVDFVQSLPFVLPCSVVPCAAAEALIRADDC